jgi:hypothetical protein
VNEYDKISKMVAKQIHKERQARHAADTQDAILWLILSPFVLAGILCLFNMLAHIEGNL